MSEEARELRRRGLISDKAYNAMAAKTKAQRSKMAPFAKKTKDEGTMRGAIPGTTRTGVDTNQRKGSAVASAPRNGVAGNASPIKRGQVNANGKATAPGDKVGRAKKTVGVHGGTNQRSGPLYGGPASRADG